MRIKNKNNKLLILLAVGAIIVGIILLGLTRNNGQTATSNQNGGPTPEQTQAETKDNATGKQNFIEGSKPGSNSGSGASPTPQSPSIELSGRQESNGSVTVFTKLHTISSGTCDLVIKNGANQITRSASVIFQPEFSTCAGFSIPVSDLGSGNWDINLTVSTPDQNYTKNISYEVK